MSITPATSYTHGPVRKVTGTRLRETGYQQEVLECGHDGKVLHHGEEPRTRRRCWDCLTPLQKYQQTGWKGHLIAHQNSLAGGGGSLTGE